VERRCGPLNHRDVIKLGLSVSSLCIDNPLMISNVAHMAVTTCISRLCCSSSVIKRLLQLAAAASHLKYSPKHVHLGDRCFSTSCQACISVAFRRSWNLIPILQGIHAPLVNANQRREAHKI
jgi:hypothetical protein